MREDRAKEARAETGSDLRTTLVRILGLAGAFYVAGRLALLLAIPPGYATAIWPPAGIALACVVVGGPRLWPGVLLGSFLVNFVTSLETRASGGVAESAALALGIGSGAAAQALAGYGLIRRFVGLPTPLIKERDIALFLVLGGPVGCLVNSCLGVLCLYLSGVIAPAQALTHWWTWWVGDSIGVAFVTPLVLIWYAEPRRIWERRKRTVALPLVILFVFAVGLFFGVSFQQAESIRLGFEAQTGALAHVVRQALDEHVDSIRSVESLFVSSHEVTAEEFHLFAERELANRPGIRMLTWSALVPDDGRGAHEPIIALDPDGREMPAARRPEYVPVRCVEPRSGNEDLIGFDTASLPERHAAQLAALATGRLAVAAGSGLGTDDPSDFVLVLPIFEAGRPHATEHEREVHLRGYVEGTVRLRALVLLALERPGRTGMGLRLLDRTGSGQARALWSSADGPADEQLEGTNALRREHALDFAGRRLALAFEGGPEYVAGEARAWNAWGVLAGVLLLSSLIGAFLLTATGRTFMVQELVAARTSELSHANETLEREIAERVQAEKTLREKEQQLLQAQKMEAIGRLAGGVAHDFNNFLTGILGYAELLEMRSPPGAPDRKELGEIVRAAERAAGLTRQLLSFSRREVVETRVLDPNAAIRNVTGMLKSLAGEEIRLELALDSDMVSVRIGRGHIEQIVMNLAVNARDAIHSSGIICIATAREERDGKAWVALSVRDNGVGMDQATKLRLYEPYFTTKEHGRGTGLGLATVYGIVKQAGGEIRVESEPGRGTTFTILLPGVEDRSWSDTALTLSSGGREFVLVVEDDQVVRSVAVAFLRERGYQVLEAADGSAAIALVQAHSGPIHCVLTDVVMPRMSGPALVKTLRRLRPDIEVVYMSGYAADLLDRLDGNSSFLAKPFRAETLAHVVREALDRKNAPATRGP